MVLRACKVAVARAAAILVAATVSGAPRVLALHASPEAHRCSCRAHAGGHDECACALCQRAALAARATDSTVPPCHRAAARRDLARGEQTRTRGVPCVEGRCGFPEDPTTMLAGLEPFFPPSGGLAVTFGRDQPLLDRLQHPRLRPIEPETPPPRAS